MRKFIALCIVLSLVACGAQKVKQEAIYIDGVIDHGGIIETVKNGNLTSTETMVLQHAISTYHRMSDKYQDKILYGGNTSMVEAKQDFNMIARQYRQLVDIVLRHWEEYDEAGKHQMIDFDKHARQLEKGFKWYEQERNVLSMIEVVIQYSGVIAGVVNKAGVEP